MSKEVNAVDGVPKLSEKEALAVIQAMKSNIDYDDDIDFCCASDAFEGAISSCSKALEKVFGIYDPAEWGDDDDEDEDEEDE